MKIDLFVILILLPAVSSAAGQSNPYSSGCLYRKNLTSTKRICNSQDSDDNQEICHVPAFVSYDPEIRLIAQDWTTAIFETWIIQIILSELLDVATSVETGSPNNKLNFYYDSSSDSRSNFLEELSNVSTYYYTAFDNAYRLKDCTLANRGDGGDDEAYEPCGHFITESWGARKGKVQDYVYRGILDPPQSLGALGQEGWHIPKITAERDPTLLSYLGLGGEENREKLASRFKRPTTWKYYCDNISRDNCTTPDDTAKMAPTSPKDYGLMFADGLYKGYFRSTEKNDCTANPLNCTGHMVDYPCQWSSPAVTQAHYLNIAVDGDGSQDNELHSYSYSQMIQIWRAANATKSDVMMYWWSPSELIGEFQNSDFEFVRIDMPTPTQECLDYRITATERCSEDPLLRIGDPRSVCEEPPNSLHSLMVSTLYGSIHHHESSSSSTATAEAARSPAYDMLKNFRITELQLEEMFVNLQESDGDPREAVCNWAASNFDYLSSFAPHTYPREYIKKETDTPLVLASFFLASSTITSTLLMTAFLFLQRKAQWVKKLQLELLYITIGGVLLVALSALLMSIPTQSGWSCTLEVWLLGLGYTMMLVPTIVTVQAINSASRIVARRRRIARTSLLRAFALLTSLIVVFLILWTAIDNPQVQPEFQLLDDEQDTGALVAVSTVCHSESMAWRFVSVGWVVLLLLITSVLAFQMSQVTLAEFDESPTLALLIYSHLLFACLILVTYCLHGSSGASEYVLSRARSVIFSADGLGVLIIYFLPKLRQSMKAPQRITRRSRHGGIAMIDESNTNDEESGTDEVPILKARIQFLEGQVTQMKERTVAVTNENELAVPERSVKIMEIGGTDAVSTASPLMTPIASRRLGSNYGNEIATNNNATISSVTMSQYTFDDCLMTPITCRRLDNNTLSSMTVSECDETFGKNHKCDGDRGRGGSGGRESTELTSTSPIRTEWELLDGNKTNGSTSWTPWRSIGTILSVETPDTTSELGQNTESISQKNSKLVVEDKGRDSEHRLHTPFPSIAIIYETHSQDSTLTPSKHNTYTDSTSSLAQSPSHSRCKTCPFRG